MHLRPLRRFGRLLRVAGIAASLRLCGDTVFQADFSGADPGSVPTNMMVLDGQFAVREEGGNRFLELPDSPLETFGVLFGPGQKDGLTVSARISSTGKGRRFPTFAVSLGGASGYRLQIAPAKKSIELVKSDAPIKSVPFSWVSGKWTWLKLSLEKTGASAWTVRGKAWPEGEAEPQEWLLSLDLAEEPVSGKPGLWGCPFAGTPIRFDDLKVESGGMAQPDSTDAAQRVPTNQG